MNQSRVLKAMMVAAACTAALDILGCEPAPSPIIVAKVLRPRMSRLDHLKAALKP
jgi:hypothetical protein